MKYGFIGCGNMGGAIASAISQITKEIVLTDISGKDVVLSEELGCLHSDGQTICQTCDCVVLAVKPQVMKTALQPLRAALQQKKPLIVTMAAGLSMEQISAMIGATLPMIRIMPNTPVSVGKGMIVYCCNDLVTKEMLDTFLFDMQYAGTLDPLDEHLIDVASALSGSGPAFMYMFLEALADGAVACGLPRQKALKYAATTMRGAAEMILTSGQHPGELKDAVCSPGGSTIVGVKTLENHGFRGAAISCVMDAYQKNLDLGK